MAAANNNMPDLFWALIAIVVVVVVVLGVVYSLRYAFTYAVHGSELSIVILGLTVQRLSLSDIECVEVIPFAALLPFSRSFRRDAFFSWKWCGYRRRVVAIRRRAGLIKGIIISPEGPERFSGLLKVVSPEAGEHKGVKPLPANGPK